MTPQQKSTLSLLLPNEMSGLDLIVPRGDLPEQLNADIQSADTVKLLVAGQRGMGKTTELRRFVRLVDGGHFLPVFLQFGAQEAINEPGLIYAMAQSLFSERKARLEEKSIRPIQDWYSQETVLTTEEKGSEGRAAFGGELPILAARKEIRRRVGSRTKKSRTVVKDITELLNRFNDLIERARRASRKRIVFVVDDIDKVRDSTSVQNTFIHSSHILCAINCPCIFTVPITYATSPYLRIAALPYQSTYRVPAVDLFDAKGERNEEAFAFMRRVFELRMPFNPLSSELIDRVLEYSGGVLIDAMRMLRGICKHKILNPTVRVDGNLIDHEFQNLVEEYAFVFNSAESWKKLSTLYKIRDKRAFMTDEMLTELLYKMVVIEYRRRHVWFDLHPAARRLYEQNAELIDARLDR